MLPWCVMFTPQPDSEPPLRHQRSWKFSVGALLSMVQVGTAEAKMKRVIDFVIDTPFTVAASVPLLPSLNDKYAVPTSVYVTFAGSKLPESYAGPVVR